MKPLPLYVIYDTLYELKWFVDVCICFQLVRNKKDWCDGISIDAQLYLLRALLSESRMLQNRCDKSNWWVKTEIHIGEEVNGKVTLDDKWQGESIGFIWLRNWMPHLKTMLIN